MSKRLAPGDREVTQGQQATQRHVCASCPRPIESGERYVRVAWRTRDGSTIVEKYHRDCSAKP